MTTMPPTHADELKIRLNLRAVCAEVDEVCCNEHESAGEIALLGIRIFIAEPRLGVPRWELAKHPVPQWLVDIVATAMNGGILARSLAVES
ncbi:MAG: hypothetical protein WCO89_09955 [Syntrophus sp. (in: bacteria)]